MQVAHQNLKYQLWDKLKVIYDRYKNQSSVIETSRIKQIITDVLGETTKQEIDYVINNMFRLDADGSGTVDFLEFGNFLFKKHCGEMSLQKMHKQGRIKNGTERKITLDQFLELVNQAYKFLKVKADKALAQKIFKEADKDEDNLITYVQYFKFIEKYVCQSQAQFAQYQKSPEKIKEPEPPKVENERQWNSRVRLYLWFNLRKLYDIFVSGRELKADDGILKELIRFIIGDISQNQINFILNGLFKLERSKLQFVPFAIAFFLLVAELGLTRFQNNNSLTKKTLNADQFILLLTNTFKFLSIGKIRRTILLLIFGLIDKNKDGWISINEYLDWVKRFLSVEGNRGDYYYLKQDDDSIEGGDIFEADNIFVLDPLSSRINSNLAQNLYFSNWDLSDLVRKRVLELLIPYDINKDLKFHSSQIASALKGILKESDFQIEYVTRNVFRYDRDGDHNVTYEELTDFFVQQHFGEMAIQRLHKLGKYSRGKERIMNQVQFGITLNNALSYIGLQVSPEHISLLFSQLDSKKSGWISYELYFLFLKYYFGSLRGKIRPSTSFLLESDSQWYNSLKNLSALDRFIRLLFDQLRKIFLKYDYNKNMLFQENQIEAILSNFFGFNEQQVNHVFLTFFNFEKRQNKSLTFDELVKILLEIYFIDIILKRRYKDVQSSQWRNRRISQQQFIDLVLTACSFLQRRPVVEDLIQIFRLLDSDQDGFISFAQYVDFIIKYLGMGLNHHIQPKDPKPSNNKPGNDKPSQISGEQWNFIEQIWGQLKVYFDKYDTGSKGYITEQELKKFVIQVLHETTQRQLDYIFWNFFRVDPNKDKKIQFQQFAPFILNHAGQIAMQKFHRQQVLGKNTLNENELFIVFSNAFSFLSSMPKSEKSVKAIYDRIGKGSNPSYSAYVGWVNKALAKKFRK